MKILDTQTGDIHEYGTDGHDSLRVSQDGRYLTYYNLQNGDGSAYGDYRFVCDDDKVPAESETADARHANVYFNIGGWHKRPQGELAKEVWELYEKHRPYLATYVYEFGEELKELLDKYREGGAE